MKKEDVYRLLNRKGIDNAKYLFYIKKKGEVVSESSHERIYGYDTSSWFDKDNIYKEFETRYEIKKIAFQKIDKRFRDVYLDLYVLFIKKLLENIINSRDDNVIFDSYVEMKLIPFKDSNALDKIDVLMWFFNWVIMSRYDKEQVLFFQNYRVFWEQYKVFIQNNITDNDENGESFSEVLTDPEVRPDQPEDVKLLNSAKNWEIAFALRRFAEEPRKKFKTYTKAYKSFIETYKFFVKIKNTDTLEKAFSKHFSQTKNEEIELLTRIPEKIQKLIDLFEQTLKKPD